MILRRALAISLLISIARSSLAVAQDPAPDAGQAPDAGAPAAPPVAPVTAVPLAPPSEPPPLVPSTQQSAAAPPSALREVPVATWISAGLAAALFGVALGFGVAANDIDHRAGVSLSSSGVDLNLTRRTALAGQLDANVANGLFIGAGVAALVGLAFAAFTPEPASRWESATPASLP